MVRKGAMLKRPAAGLSSDDEPAAKDVAHVGVCYWPAHEICSLAIVCIWSYLCLALLCGYTALAFSLRYVFRVRMSLSCIQCL